MSRKGLDVRLIGTVALLRDGEPLTVSGRRIRALLTLLALSAGRTVSIETLAAGVWDKDPPERIRGSLQTYVGRLRGLLGVDVLSTQPAGYRLELSRADVDLLACADAAEQANDSAAPRQALATVLERWNDEPFGDPPSEWISRHEAPAWVERRLQILERWVDLCFDANEHASCLVDLNREVQIHPLRETLWVRLLAALDRSGRTAEALERYEAVRKRLADELGVDPSPGLRAAHAQLLERSDGGQLLSERSTPRVVPRQLPAPVAGFVGRTAQIERLDAVLRDDEAADSPCVVALHGPAGSGKTTLALHWAYRVVSRFPDGQLFLNLQGFGPGEPMDTGRALDTLLRGIGVHGSQIPVEIDERAALWRSEATGRRMLVLLDNARETEVVRTLLPGGACVVLVTSRNQLRSLAVRDGARRVSVDPMNPDEAVELLSGRIDRPASAGDLRELAELCGHLPVALAVAAEQVDRATHYTVGVLRERLNDGQSLVDALSTGDDDPSTNVRAVLHWSYQALEEDAARLFRYLGLYTGPRLSVGAAAALAGLERERTERLLDRLVSYHLLYAAETGWYETHDLIRDFARELVGETETEAERVVVVRRLRSWFLHSAENAQSAWRRPSVALALPDPGPGVYAEQFDDARSAVEWLTEHAHELRSSVARGAVNDDPIGVMLGPALYTHLNSIGVVSHEIALFRDVEASAARQGDAGWHARAANLLAAAYMEVGDSAEMLAWARRARDLYSSVELRDGCLGAQANIAIALALSGDGAQTVAAFAQLIDDARRYGDPRHLGPALFNASAFYCVTGAYPEALRTAEESVIVLRQAGHMLGDLANALHTLGDALAAVGRRDEAVERLTEALTLHRRTKRRSGEVRVLHTRGLVERDLGLFPSARRSWQQALDVLSGLGLDGIKEVGRADLRGLIEGLGPAADPASE